jgi:GNAT superfamily N-acetyltransferase
MITIKMIESTAVDLVVKLFDAYRMFYHQASNSEGAKQFLTERLLKKESIIFIAMENEDAVGFCQLYPIFSSVSMQRTWLLNDLYVDEKQRGKGIATHLLNAAKDYGVQTNAKWLLLQTGADNTLAQALYKKNKWNKVQDYFYELPL